MPRHYSGISCLYCPPVYIGNLFILPADGILPLQSSALRKLAAIDAFAPFARLLFPPVPQGRRISKVLSPSDLIEKGVCVLRLHFISFHAKFVDDFARSSLFSGWLPAYPSVSPCFAALRQLAYRFVQNDYRRLSPCRCALWHFQRRALICLSTFCSCFFKFCRQ